ncbi:MAG: RNA polymerase factor sigma-32 [Rhodospirillaceae bacterium]|nr:RNA polymerase factor sigma-32 [Rhodospirillaceae bacterium]
MNQIKTYPVLTEQEERDLIVRWYEHGDKRAFDALIASHLRLVPKIAQKYSGYGIDVNDLISEGNLGLLHSVERFKPEKGFRFSTYARWWIKASILNFVLQTWSLIKVGNGAHKKRLFFNLRRAKQNLHVDGQRYLSEQDIDVLAKRFGVSREDVVAMDQRLSANDVSLAQPIGHGNDGDSITMADTIADDKPTPEAMLVEADDRAWRSEVLREAVSKLDSREREILTRRYMTERPVTLSKLATVYGLTAERVRQIEAKAIGKIRQYLRPKMRQLAPA